MFICENNRQIMKWMVGCSSGIINTKVVRVLHNYWPFCLSALWAPGKLNWGSKSHCSSLLINSSFLSCASLRTTAIQRKLDLCYSVSHVRSFCTHYTHRVAGLLLCFHAPVDCWYMINLHTSTQNLIHATAFPPLLGVSYQSWAHGCPLTQNTSLSAASCFLFSAHDTSLAHSASAMYVGHQCTS